MKESPTTILRRFVTDLVDLVVAGVLLLLLVNLAPEIGPGVRGPVGVAVFVGYFVVVSRIGRGVGELLTATRIVDRRSNGTLRLWQAIVRALVEAAGSFVLALMGFGVVLGLTVVTGLATGEAVWPLVLSFVLAILTPPAVDAATAAVTHDQGLWDLVSGSTLRRTAQPRTGTIVRTGQTSEVA